IGGVGQPGTILIIHRSRDLGWMMEREPNLSALDECNLLGYGGDRKSEYLLLLHLSDLLANT
ncbi:hypothetical protein, partial [Serratia marcescens]|uniref:hypothetical protein n=1 Tax=Serratia marcescens TaxID=615 RepID=UPI001C651F49